MGFFLEIKERKKARASIRNREEGACVYRTLSFSLRIRATSGFDTSHEKNIVNGITP